MHPPPVLLIVAMLLELSCGLLLIVGYRTRVVALVLAAYSVATAVVFNHAFGDPNQMIHFVKNLAIAGGLLAFVANGAGAFSVDSRLSRFAARAMYVA
jgi:putative oxidoreductase